MACNRLTVQFRLSPPRGLSSSGRASALQAEGGRFEPDRLHLDYNKIDQNETNYFDLRII